MLVEQEKKKEKRLQTINSFLQSEHFCSAAKLCDCLGKQISRNYILTFFGRQKQCYHLRASIKASFQRLQLDTSNSFVEGLVAYRRE